MNEVGFAFIDFVVVIVGIIGVAVGIIFERLLLLLWWWWNGLLVTHFSRLILTSIVINFKMMIRRKNDVSASKIDDVNCRKLQWC